jgi:peptidoglycan/xylan/chitin deacetylase (PgdA/CDA1 family)
VAISLSFDDARPSQIHAGLPLLDRFGVKGTFYVLPSEVEKLPEGWKKAVANGHELGSHSFSHPCTGNYAFSLDNALEGYTLGRMRQELDRGIAQVQRLVGMRPATFAYPCGQKFVGRGRQARSYVPQVAERFLAARGYRDEAANDPVFCDLAQLTGMGMDGMKYQELLRMVSRAADEGRWLILAGHDIGESAWQTTDAGALEALCKYAADPANGVWMDTVATIGGYIQRQRTRPR